MCSARQLEKERIHPAQQLFIRTTDQTLFQLIDRDGTIYRTIKTESSLDTNINSIYQEFKTWTDENLPEAQITPEKSSPENPLSCQSSL